MSEPPPGEADLMPSAQGAKSRAGPFAGPSGFNRPATARSTAVLPPFFFSHRSSSKPWSKRWQALLAAVATAQLLTLLVFGFATIFNYKFFAPIDEEAHYSYVQHVAQDWTLPVLGKTLMSYQAIAIGAQTYPKLPNVDRAKLGLPGLSYEAFQPPLYYIVAAPVFSIIPGYLNKAYALRLFDFALYLVAVFYAGKLSISLFGEAWLLPFSFALLVFDLPGEVVRSITISNNALAVPITIAFVTELWEAWNRQSPRRLAIAGILLGGAMLTELELVALAPLFGVVLLSQAWKLRHRLAAIRPVIVAAVLPLLLFAPWIAFNEVNFHSFTAGKVAVAEQAPYVNPHHDPRASSHLPARIVENIFYPAIPQEWGAPPSPNPFSQAHPWTDFFVYLVDGLTVPLALLGIFSLKGMIRSMRTAVLALPFLVELVVLCAIYLTQHVADIRSRYTYPSLPGWAMLGAYAATNAVTDPRIVLSGVAIGWFSVLLLWIELSRMYLGL